MRIQMKQMIFTLGFIVGLVVSGVFFLMPKTPTKRGPASAEVLEKSAQTKIQMIQSLSFKNESGSLQLTVINGLEDLCENWQEMQVIVQADGVAVSGTPPQVSFTSPCQDRHFAIQFSNDTHTWGESERGFADVGAEQYYVSNVVLSGPLGTMNIQAPEILTHLNQSFEFQKR